MKPDQVITDRASVREALRAIDSAPNKLALVVDGTGKLLRTMSDGDIRRGLLNGATPESPIAQIGGRQPVVCDAATKEADILSLMDGEAVSSVVVIDDDGRPASIVDRQTLEGMVLLSPPHMGENELKFVHEAFDANWIAPAGPQSLAFEEEFAALLGVENCVALSSGTAALHLALRVLRVEPGDAVYVSDLTFAASLQPILYEHAIPVLIDSEPLSWNMSPAALGRRLEEDAAKGTLPKAVILVHLYGQPANTAEIAQLCANYGVPVIEDAAESLGARDGNSACGGRGALAAFSFNGNKIITTSGGGALVGSDKSLIDLARKLSTQGRDDADHYQHSQVAYNYRMSNVLAGIGRGQLQALDEKVAARRRVYQNYVEGLGDIPGVYFQQDVPGSEGSRWLTVIGLDPDRIAIHPYVLMRYLKDKGIETRPGWKPMHLQPLCRGMDFVTHSPTEAISARLFLQTLCLPSGSSLAEDKQGRIIDLVRNILTES